MPGKQPPPLPGLANPSSFLLEPEPASIVRSMDLFDMESGKAFDTNIWTNKEIASVKFVYVCMIQRGITAIIYFVLRCPPPCSHMSFLADFRPNIHSHRHPSIYHTSIPMQIKKTPKCHMLSTRRARYLWLCASLSPPERATWGMPRGCQGPCNFHVHMAETIHFNRKTAVFLEKMVDLCITLHLQTSQCTPWKLAAGTMFNVKAAKVEAITRPWVSPHTGFRMV